MKRITLKVKIKKKKIKIILKELKVKLKFMENKDLEIPFQKYMMMKKNKQFLIIQ